MILSPRRSGAWRGRSRAQLQGQTDEEFLESIRTLYGSVVVLESGARGATTSLVENGQGDVYKIKSPCTVDFKSGITIDIEA